MEALNKLELIEQQRELCNQYSARYVESPIEMKVGVSLSVRRGEYPVHGLRRPIEGNTTGWYIWSGDFSDDVDFFQPLHVKHLYEWNPKLLKYLGLAPGWRFLIAPNYEDVWQDLTLLNT